MKPATRLVEIRRRSRNLPPQGVDPLRAIHQRCVADPETLENRTLMRVTRAIEEGRGDFDDADIWALGREALGLVDALVEGRMSGQVRRRRLPV